MQSLSSLCKANGRFAPSNFSDRMFNADGEGNVRMDRKVGFTRLVNLMYGACKFLLKSIETVVARGL